MQNKQKKNNLRLMIKFIRFNNEYKISVKRKQFNYRLRYTKSSNFYKKGFKT